MKNILFEIINIIFESYELNSKLRTESQEYKNLWDIPNIPFKCSNYLQFRLIEQFH